VIIGGERAGRPNEFVEASVRQSSLLCPFCAGNEAETPDAIAVYANGRHGWLVRVVPNKFPAVTIDTAICPTCQPLSEQAASQPVPGFGRHEVIIESPRHVASLSELTPDECKNVFAAYRDRLADLKAQKQFRYVQIFKNVGSAAGASLEHVHSQLVALPGVPEVVQHELAASHEYFQQHQKSLLPAIIEQELAAGDRIVAQYGNLVAFCPYASRFPYEVWVAPKRHAPRFEDTKAGELGELSRIMVEVIGRIERATGQSAYNYHLHTQPFDMPAADHYHWHIEIIPRLTKVAGFEWGTGCFINPHLPEAAAEHLRNVSGGTRSPRPPAHQFCREGPIGMRSEAAADLPMILGKCVDPA
jgi:UDPglucose--hexose-1-phosphate uridylyltransferase